MKTQKSNTVIYKPFVNTKHKHGYLIKFGYETSV